MTTIEKLTRYVDKRGCGCWWWMRAKDNSGYGMAMINGKSKRVHRIFHETYNGEIPKGLVVMHLCGNRACVNPNHLLSGTQADNMQWDRLGIDLTKCKRGHELSGDNVRTYSGNRNCVTCMNDRLRRWKSANKDKVATYYATHRNRVSVADATLYQIKEAVDAIK